MRNEFRNELVNSLSRLAGELSNASNFTAYPQMQFVFFNLGASLDTMGKALLREEIESMLYGKTPWAKLYKMSTGHDLTIDPSMVGSVLPGDGHSYYYPTPLKRIVDYWFKYRGKFAASNHTISSVFSVNGWTVAVDYGTFSAEAETLLNDMVIEIKDIQKSEAAVNCPLFDEPISIMLSDGFLAALRKDIYDRFVKEDDYVKDFNAKTFITDKYFGKLGVEAIEQSEDHPHHQLYKLLESSTYSNAGRSWCDVMVNDEYSVRLVSRTNWNCVENKTLVVEYVHHHVLDANGDPRPAVDHRWEDNPHLVKDIVDNIDRIIDDALTAHHADVS